MIKRIAVFGCMIAVLFVACGGKPKPVEKPADTSFKAVVETIDSMYVASLAKIGPYSGFGAAMGELMAWIGKNKVVPTGAPFGVYYDDPTKTKPDSTKFEVCIPVPAQTKGDKAVKVVDLEPAQVAVAIHIGPYDKVGETYGKLMGWITANKYVQSGAPREYYLSDPAKVPAESLQTKIAIPVTTLE